MIRLFERPLIAVERLPAFREFTERQQRRMAGPILLIGTLAMVGALPLERWILFDLPDALFAVRAIVPIALAALVLGFFQFKQRSQIAYDVARLAIPVIYSLVLCGIVTVSDAPLAPFYAAANNVTVMFAVLILGLRPRAAATAGGCVILVEIVLLPFAGFATTEFLLVSLWISVFSALAAFYGTWRLDIDRRLQFNARDRDAQLLRELSLQNDVLERLSALDPLTGLLNRRGLDAATQAIWEQGAETGSDVSVVAVAIIDIDHFKLFNDTLGHTAGDEALQEVGRALQKSVGDHEVVARLGGEEFMVVTSHTTREALGLLAARLRASVERLAIHHPASPTGRIVTVSIGISYAASQTLGRVDMRQLLETADAALYRVKSRGRDGWVIIPHVQGDGGDLGASAPQAAAR